MAKNSLFLASILSFFLMITGCGIDGAGEIEGVVAAGAPIEADVVLIDSAGQQIRGRSNAEGEYAFNMRGFLFPFMIRATADDGRILYAYAVKDQSVVNVTPVTSYILDQTAVEKGLLGGASQLFASFRNNRDITAALQNQVAAFNAVVATAMEEAGVAGFDHFASAFEANHEGYDAFLDALDIEMDGDDIVMRIGDTILETLAYDFTDGMIAVSGQVVNALTDANIYGASLTFANDSGVVSATTDVDGGYSVSLQNFRRYDITVSASGFRTVHYYNISTFALNEISAETIPMIATDISGNGTVAGTVINARTAGGLSGVSIAFREGINNRDGSVVATASTDHAGNYSVPLETGVYTAEFSRNGFTKAYSTVVSIAGETTSNINVAMVAETVAGLNNSGAFATIVLAWGENPRDLDSHLTGPVNSSDDRFHIAYYSKIATTDGQYTDAYSLSGFDPSNPCATEGIAASLDLDDVTSYGPETTTICRAATGEYHFYVHHYSGTSSITESPARVVVSTASGVTRTFIAPPGATGTSSDVWHVFDLDSNGNIIPVNTFSLGTDTMLSSSFTHSERPASDEGLIDNLPAK
jgi:hypothetical protein